MSAPVYDTPGNSLTSSPPHNNVEMTRDMLGTVLEYFSQLLPKYFDWNVVQSLAAQTAAAAKPLGITPMVDSQPMPQGMRLVVHGGACMLLHPGLYNLSKQQQQSPPGLKPRTKTRDVDYIHRGFMAEYGTHIPDAAERLKDCIQATAARFKLGADWMNSDADIALPMAKECVFLSSCLLILKHTDSESLLATAHQTGVYMTPSTMHPSTRRTLLCTQFTAPRMAFSH